MKKHSKNDIKHIKKHAKTTGATCNSLKALRKLELNVKVYVPPLFTTRGIGQ